MIPLPHSSKVESGKINIAVDGHSSCGKSTLAKALASRLGYIYIDSGAMYRAVTLYSMRNGIISDGAIDRQKLLDALDNFEIDFRYDSASGTAQTFLDGENVERFIREMEISKHVGLVSPIREVREKLVKFQQDIGKGKGVVMDGRDIGTAVFPDAELKLFMTANVDVRAGRRYKELLSKGMEADLEEVKANLVKRDHDDSTRKVNPLVVAEDAHVIDNSELDEVEQFEIALKMANKVIMEVQP